ncbi:hypothetical protein THAOC_03342 [Thalassiosira oceanica]|uniref:Uncharacterized protein n=1 Tax=Thalassiosira oceanica TaxID=159749 RepID=K0TPV4_THAOC|nr:hypothetical protein THAOC_03342 [Thalassiosira oceanica]|eukprot:EJK74952.1 hypothetical protein THAOC_03342 [Thalassiosira oceanica]
MFTRCARLLNQEVRIAMPLIRLWVATTDLMETEWGRRTHMLVILLNPTHYLLTTSIVMYRARDRTHSPQFVLT